MPEFAHLHCHTQYSLLDGAAKIPFMLDKAVADGMPAAAITDHGNMFGVFEFVNEAHKRNIKPVVGCEFYLVEDRFAKKFTKQYRDKRYHQLLLAKNPKGYQNLAKLCSLGYTEGLYSKWPRIDKELIKQYHEGLICTSCCIGAEIPQAIIHKGEAEAEKIFKWWYDLFGEDFYVELQRHFIEDIDGTGVSQEDVNQVLIKFARKYDVKIIATNDSHYIDQDDWNAHDILLCVNTGDKQSTQQRFKFANDQFFFKSSEEMAELFKDIPEAIENTVELIEKVETPKLKRDILMPNFDIPHPFTTMDEYLRHLCFEGARQKYGEINSIITERIDYELGIIGDMGFAGYFLIVQDFINAAQEIGVRVGPGRGSAAGSAVAYATGITNVDPIKYNLLFERFLNPERVSMPDIDIDFDDQGRQRVIDYVVEKYGKNQVAQIITFGTMAAKSSIRDVARVLDLPLPDADYLAKLIPEAPGTNLKKALKEVEELREIKAEADLRGKTFRMAESLEGSVRQTGVHAAGVIIAPDDISNYVPVSTAKDSDLTVTQFEGKYVEDAGMLKMDFLGLKTLSIINDALALIKQTHNIDIDTDAIPLDDPKTYELFQRGATVGIFQYESDGMQKYLKELCPEGIEDLIAMNALYRPGPMDYIPLFVDRRHGRKEIEYPHPLLEELLKPTYGIMVYQEQIMQCAQIIGGFSLGSADILRRAMGKKKMDVMEQQKVIFIEGAKEKDIDEQKATEIFEIMMEFAKYGFNRSHSAAYAILAYQTAYLKAHYPAQYFAAVMTHNMNDMTKLEFFLQGSKAEGVVTLGPDINQSIVGFNVNQNEEIRYALSGVKGVGVAAVEAIVEEREANGPYKSIFDFTKRVNLRAVNRRAIENLILAGAFDGLEITLNRSQYFVEDLNGNSLIQNAVKFGNSAQSSESMMKNSLFGDIGGVELKEPDIPEAEEWSMLEKLNKEKEMVGIYISGHPLDEFSFEIQNFCNCRIEDIDESNEGEFTFGALVAACDHRISQKGDGWGRFTVMDYNGSFDIRLFKKDYLEFKHYFDQPGRALRIKGKYNRWSNGEMNFKLLNVELLSELMESESKHAEIMISTHQLSAQTLSNLSQLCQTHPGGKTLRIKIGDVQEQYEVLLHSRTTRVEISKEFLSALDDLELKYKLR